MADETRTVLDEEWRPAFGGVAGAHGQRLLNTDDEPTDVARVKIAIQGKRALVLLLQSSQRPTSTCPTCGGPMTGHTAACAMGSSSGLNEPQPAESAEVPPAPEVWDGTPMSLLYVEKRCQESAANVLPAGATLPDLMDQSVLLSAKPSRGKTAARWASYYVAADGHKARYSCVIEVNHAPVITLD